MNFKADLYNIRFDLLFYVPLTVCRGSVLLFVLYAWWYCKHLDEEERAGCFALLSFWMSRYCKGPVALPHGAVGWSADCDCGIS